MQKYTLPDFYQQKIESLVAEHDFSLNQPKAIANAVLKLSDHYQSQKRSTPWTTPEFIVAYASYFFPLNYIRNLKIWDEAKNVGFPNFFSQILDFGCGFGSSYLAGKDSLFLPSNSSLFAIDSSPHPLHILKKYFLPEVSFQTALPKTFKNTLGIFSYSLNELQSLPHWIFELDHIMIAEPSTAKYARELMELRATLIAKEYSIWAPCTHHLACPLLTKSKTDWCHDRVQWIQPDWFHNLEQHLPIKNHTLTTSYLLASKIKPTISYFGRIVGDELVEKGKTRWMLCRKEEREFLSHLARKGDAPKWKRGHLFKDTLSYEQKANELRLL